MARPMNLATSAMIVLEQLVREGPLCPKEISSKTGLAPRTVSHALKTLIDRKLCARTPNFNDMRSPLYHVNKQKAREMQITVDKLRAQIEFRLSLLR
ncbi:MAG: MarR family transcriptional regulator [Candidatus Thorarchaeota archaeon]